MNNKERIILGIDPGTNVMGYGLIKATGNKAEMIAMGVIDRESSATHTSDWVGYSSE